MRGFFVGLLCISLAACDSTGGRESGGTGGNGSGGTGGSGSGGTGGAGSSFDLSMMGLPPSDGGGGGTDPCLADPKACYTVYAHGDHTLYKIDLMAKTLVTVGPFKAPMVIVGSSMVEDGMTDLAVAPDDTIYVVSKTNLYKADPGDGHVTLVGPITACGTSAVAMTFTADGSMYVGDHQGAFCKVDPKNPSSVTKLTLSDNFALSGDIVAVDDGTMYGSATITDPSTMKPTTASAANNLLVKIDPATGKTTQIGSIGSKNLFGLSYALGKVFGFTHDCSGGVVVIDPKTGAGSAFNMFADPAPNCTEKGNTGKGISFAGAGVNSMVQAGPVS